MYVETGQTTASIGRSSFCAPTRTVLEEWMYLGPLRPQRSTSCAWILSSNLSLPGTGSAALIASHSFENLKEDGSTMN